MEKIDFVLPWVDASDPYWVTSKKQYEDSGENQEDNHTITRFRDMNTLKYALRSIEKNCPWFHKIYLITTGHIPDWLDLSHPKIKLITHEELFIDKTALPVFNSNAIEMNLVNIRGLSEKFVYLNDDMIIWKPLKIDRFFTNNKPVDFFHHAWIPRNKLFELLKGKDIWIDAINNNIRLINEKFIIFKIDNNQYYHHSYKTTDKVSNFFYINLYKKVFWIKHWHHPQPYCKKTIQEVYKTYPKEMIACSHNKFRSSSDITPYLYRYWHLIKGDFSPYDHQDGFVAKITNFSYLQKILKKLKENEKINFVCFNDQMNDISDKEFKQTSIILENYLKNIFPTKASFEK